MKNSKNLWAAVILIGLFVFIGVSVNYHYSTEETVTDEQAVLDRAYQDVVAEENSDDISTMDIIIKIFDGNDELIDSRVLKPEELPDEEFSSLMNQSSLIAEYNNSYIYKIKE